MAEAIVRQQQSQLRWEGSMKDARVAIIGAGPAGLVNAKFLADLGFIPEIFESGDDVGGQWNARAPLSGVWPSMVTNTSALMTAFSDLPHPPDTAVYATERQMLAYLRRFAAKFDLYERLRLRTRVQRVEPGPQGWTLGFAGPDGTSVSERFPRVVVASGRYNRPWVPSIPGLDRFAGCGGATHAFGYKERARYRGLRVLVAGGNISALEIASDLAMLGAARVINANRRQRYVLPKLLAGIPHDQIARTRYAARAAGVFAKDRVAEARKAFILRANGSPEHYGTQPADPDLAKAGVALSQYFLPLVAEGRIITRPWIAGIDGSRVEFSDGSSEIVDAIIFATGYALHLPFLHPAIGAALDLDQRHADLYQYTLHPDLPGLAFAGLYEAAGPYFPTLELQARWIAHVWAGVTPLPSQGEMRDAITADRANRGGPQACPSDVLSLLFARSAGVEPDPGRWPGLARALWFGPLSAVSFRLDGPGKLADAAARYAAQIASCGAIPTPDFSPHERALLQELEPHDPACATAAIRGKDCQPRGQRMPKPPNLAFFGKVQVKRA